MGKEILYSADSFIILKRYADLYYKGKISAELAIRKVYGELKDRGIRRRQDDGKNPRMTISVPKIGNALVVGIRYTKNNGRYTEDHYIFRPELNIYICKGKELDMVYSEYKGAHIAQP